MRPISRRTLLCGSLGGAMGLGSFSRGAARAASEATSRRIGAGIIGTAHCHARGHLRAIGQSKNYHLVAVAEPDGELLSRAKKDPAWSGVRWVSVDDLLADDKVQMVCIETVPRNSLPFARRAIRAGKHTKIDKPPGLDLNELAEIFSEAQRRRCIVQMGYVYRYNPAFRLAHRVIRAGWLGPIRSVTCQMNDMLGPAERHSSDQYPGGRMFLICCHMIDALIWMMGKPSRVSSVLRQSRPAEDDLEDDVLALFEFAQGVGVVRSHARDGKRHFYVFGERGSIRIDSADSPRVKLALTSAQGAFSSGVHQVPVGPAVRYLPDVDDLASAIREKRWVEYFTPEHDLAVHEALLTASGVRTPGPKNKTVKQN